MIDSAGQCSELRVMVLAPNWLGDVVMHTPLLSLMHENRDNIQQAVGRPVVIHLGVRGSWADLFNNDRRVDKVVTLDQDRGRGGIHRTRELVRALRRGGYDVILLGPPSLRVGLAAWLARIPCRIGYRCDGRTPFLTHGLAPLPRGRVHYSREMTELGRAWLKSLGTETAVSPSGEPRVELPGCEALSSFDFGPGPAVWAVAPGATYGEAKTWPADRLGGFIELATGKAGVRLVLLGDRTVRGFTRRLREEFSGSWSEDPLSGAAVVDMTGKTDLPTAARILKSVDAFIGNDSGLMHLAAALGTPTVGVFGSSNPEWTAPLGTASRAIVPDGFACRPCYRKTCNQPEFCLDTVSGETVFKAVQDLVARARNPREEP